MCPCTSTPSRWPSTRPHTSAFCHLLPPPVPVHWSTLQRCLMLETAEWCAIHCLGVPPPRSGVPLLPAVLAGSSTAPVIAAQSTAAQRTPLETTRWGVEATGTGLLATTPSAMSCSSLPGLRPWHQRERLPVWYPTPNPGRQTYFSPPGAVVAPWHWTSPSSPLSSSRPSLAGQTYLLRIYYVGRRARKGKIRLVYLANFRDSITV